MNPDPWPDAIPSGQLSDGLPSALEPAITTARPPILLLVAAGDEEAASRVAVRLAEARAEQGLETVLADGALEEPRLHELVELQNLEGLADLFLFGASLERVRVRAPARSFDFIPAGPYVPDPGAVLSSREWDRVARALESEGARLLLFVPADAPGLSILSKRAGEAVLIGDDREAQRAAEALDPACRVTAVIDPHAPTAAPAAAAATGAAPGAEGTAEGPAPAGREVAGARERDGVDRDELVDEGPAEPVVFRSDRKGRRAVSPVLLILLVAALIAGAWFLYQEYVASPGQSGAVEPATSAAEVSEVPRGEPVETPLPVSVAVEAHQDLATARERLEALREAMPGVGFYLAPAMARDVPYYRLLAGPVADREAGERLMERLVAAGQRTAADPWAVQPTELAFLLGEYDSRQAARARVQELAEMPVPEGEGAADAERDTLRIPAYIVPVRYEEGPPRYRVWGGAYENPAEATVMQEMLERAGIEPRLVARTGEPVEGRS